MIYTQHQIDQLISRATCCIGEKGKIISKSLRLGLNNHEKQLTDLKKLILYRFVLKEWIQEEDGSDYSDNPITLEQQNLIINDLIRACCCKDWETQEVIETDDYWEDGYTDSDDETDAGAYIS